MNKITFHNQNNKGAAMILAIIVIAVMSLLGTAIWMYSTTDTIRAAREEKKVQAYYVARSAAETVAEYIIKNPAEAVNITSKTGDGNLYDVNKSYTVKVTAAGAQTLDIQATGTVYGVSDTVTLQIARLFIPVGGTFDNVIFAMNDIDIKGNSYKIKGHVSANGKINAHNTATNIDGTVTEHCDPPRIYPSIPIPDGEVIPKNDPFDLDKNANYSFSGNKEFGKIDLKGSGNTITINTGVAGDGDVYLKVDSFKSGSIIITGENRVYMYVNSFSLSGNDEINKNGSASQFIVVANDASSIISLANGGSPVFTGVVYAPNSSVRYNGTPNITGAIISGDFSGTGDITITKDTSLDDDVLPIEVTQLTNYQKREWR